MAILTRKFVAQIEMDIDATITDLDALTHILKAVEQYNTRTGALKQGTLSVVNRGAMNYKYEGLKTEGER